MHSCSGPEALLLASCTLNIYWFKYNSLNNSDSHCWVFWTTNNPKGRLPKLHSGKEPACQCRRCGFSPWIGQIPWRRKWQPTPYSSLENPMDRGTWQAIVHGLAKSQTWLSACMCARTHTHTHTHTHAHSPKGHTCSSLRTFWSLVVTWEFYLCYLFVSLSQKIIFKSKLFLKTLTWQFETKSYSYTFEIIMMY